MAFYLESKIVRPITEVLNSLGDINFHRLLFTTWHSIPFWKGGLIKCNKSPLDCWGGGVNVPHEAVVYSYITTTYALECTVSTSHIYLGRAGSSLRNGSDERGNSNERSRIPIFCSISSTIVTLSARIPSQSWSEPNSGCHI